MTDIGSFGKLVDDGGISCGHSFAFVQGASDKVDVPGSSFAGDGSSNWPQLFL